MLSLYEKNNSDSKQILPEHSLSTNKNKNLHLQSEE